MYSDEVFTEKYDNLISTNAISLILDENELFLFKLNHKLINENTDHNLLSRQSKLALFYQNAGYSEQKCQRSTLNGIFMRADYKIKLAVQKYGEQGLINLYKSGQFNSKDDLLDDLDVIKKVIINNIELNGSINKRIEKIKKQVEIFGLQIPFIKLNSLPLSPRIINPLSRSDILTVADVCEKNNSFDEFQIIHSFGEKGFNELVSVLHQYEFLFKNEMIENNEQTNLEKNNKNKR